MSKRSVSPPAPGGAVIKRAKNDNGAASSTTREIAISSNNDPRNKALTRTVPRTSGLEAPIISLAGAHSGEILSCRFSPSGLHIAACSSDRSLSLWNTYPPNTNYALLSNIAKAPLLDLQWSLFQPWIYTVSADHMLSVVDTTTGERIRKVRAHGGIINSLDRTMAGGAGTELLVTGSDDGTVKVWESSDDGGLAKYPVTTIEVGCPVTAVCWSKDGQNVYVASLDNEIHVYDLRNSTTASANANGSTYPRTQPLLSLTGHTDTPTSLSVSPDGNFLLSPSLSSNVLIHDIRPFSPSPTRVHRILRGAPAGFENTLLKGAWTRDEEVHGGKPGQRVAVGGADRMVCVWEVESGKLMYKLPGHKGTVTSCDFHPKEPILLTGSKDGTMLLGELEAGIAV
ncbi:WD40-repeat-containing domain protein [Rhodocollybia butyracea]|uniref:WD40-repeat-containing domain protein n=1 Tax=Rhodocollybia butyracea TaxID=206335 RepID=A0A9P5P5P7_9AGAR|nr:WD40-repeat-containing domain protein [Rhodocollybia butyracea]